MKTVRNILTEKGHVVWAVPSTASVLDALKLMTEKDIGALLVMDGARLKGIFSERDYARKVAIKGKASKETPVTEVMTSEVISVQPQQSVAECMALMSRKRIRHLPVVDHGTVVGVISIGDVVRALLAEQEEALQRLEKTVSGSELLD